MSKVTVSLSRTKLLCLTLLSWRLNSPKYSESSQIRELNCRAWLYFRYFHLQYRSLPACFPFVTIGWSLVSWFLVSFRNFVPPYCKLLCIRKDEQEDNERTKLRWLLSPHYRDFLYQSSLQSHPRKSYWDQEVFSYRSHWRQMIVER